MLRIKKSSKAPSTKDGGSVISGSTVTNPYYYYVRPYTPSIDYTPTVDYSDALSRDLHIANDCPPSEFSVHSYSRSHTPSIHSLTPSVLLQQHQQQPHQLLLQQQQQQHQQQHQQEQQQAKGGEDKEGTISPETLSTTDESGRDSSPSRDSGIHEMEVPILEKEELGATCAELCRELRTVTTLSQDFHKDSIMEREAPADLLEELETKIRPFLITLDEEMSQQEVLLRKNLDRCRISDPRVSWLLRYNDFTKKFRTILTSLATDIYEDLENFLRLRSRGCIGLTLKRDIPTELRNMLQILTEVDAGIHKERLMPESAYV